MAVLSIPLDNKVPAPYPKVVLATPVAGSILPAHVVPIFILKGTPACGPIKLALVNPPFPDTPQPAPGVFAAQLKFPAPSLVKIVAAAP